MRTQTPRTSTAAPVSSRSSQPMMDPYGIYGTRSANRMRAAKKRRKVQGVLWLLTLVGLMATIVTAARVQRVASIGNDWNLDLMARPAAPPVWASAADGMVLVPTESGRLLTGKPAADSHLLPILQTGFPLRAEPVVVDNTAYIACEDGALYALSLRGARQLWRYQSDAAMTSRPAYLEYSVTASAAPDKVSSTPARPDVAASAVPATVTAAETSGPRQELRKTIIAGNDRGLVLALDAGNGRVRWRRRLPAPVGNGLVATTLSGRALVLVPLLSGLASRGGLWCLDARTGAVVWKFPDENKTLAAQLPAPVVEEGTGRVYSVNDSGAVFCLDLKTGRKTGWQKAFVPPVETHNAAVLLRSEPLLEQYDWGARLIVAGSDGGVHCFNVETGKIEWSFEAPAPVRGRLLSLNPQSGAGSQDGGMQRPVILVGCDEPGVYVLDARSGALVRKLRTRGATTGSAATAGLVKVGDGVLAISSDGLLQKFTPR